MRWAQAARKESFEDGEIVEKLTSEDRSLYQLSEQDFSFPIGLPNLGARFHHPLESY